VPMTAATATTMTPPHLGVLLVDEVATPIDAFLQLSIPFFWLVTIIKDFDRRTCVM
jgi:hypothetical protein